MKFSQLLEIIDQYKRLLVSWRNETKRRVRGHITLTGGEPFIRQDIFDLLQVFSANRKHFSFAILTNGSFIDDSLARRLSKLRPAFIQLSIEGSRTTHDEIRGPGDFDRTVSALEHLVRRHVRALISFTAHRANFRDFPQVARLGRKLRVSRVWADRLIPSGTGSGLKQEVLSPEETREFFEIMRSTRSETPRRWYRRTEIAMHRALQFLATGEMPYHCTAGDTLLCVQPNGDLYPCRRMPIRVGNLLETQLRELYYKSDLLRALRKRNSTSDGCEGCPHAKTCRGGLKCLSYVLTNDPFKADPGCWRAAVAQPQYQ